MMPCYSGRCYAGTVREILETGPDQVNDKQSYRDDNVLAEGGVARRAPKPQP